MSNIIQIQPNRDGIVSFDPGAAQREIDNQWWKLFDVRGAVKAVDILIQDKGSDGTKEQHTRKAYEASLLYFLRWASPEVEDDDGLTVYEWAARYPMHRFPGAGLMREFIAHLKSERGLKKSTIDRYMAPVRHYVTALTKQTIMAVGDEFQLVYQFKEWMRLALDEKVGEIEEKGNRSALYSYGTRLNVAQVDAMFVALVKQDDLLAKRDLAILYVGFNVALRDAEMRRLRLGNIKPGEKCWEIVVRGKRNNYAPVPLDATGYRLIMDYVETYNAGLEADDPRRITDDVPIFQPVRRGNHYSHVGVNGYDPRRGCGRSTVRDVVKRRSVEILGVEISSHDMRRTAAHIGRMNGMDYDDLQALLRHKSIETTRLYVGNPPDMSKSILSNRIRWSVDVGAA